MDASWSLREGRTGRGRGRCGVVLLTMLTMLLLQTLVLLAIVFPGAGQSSAGCFCVGSDCMAGAGVLDVAVGAGFMAGAA